MKKNLIYFFILLTLITGCQRFDSNYYFKSLEKLQEMEEKIDSDLYDIRVAIKPVSEHEYIYYITLDNAKVDLNNLSMLVYHDVDTTNSFPSIGYLDEKANIDDEVKGINLVGYIEKKSDFELINFKIKVSTKNFDNIHVITLDRD